MSKSRDGYRGRNRKLNREVGYWKALANILQRKSEELTNIYFDLNSEIRDLKDENDRLTKAETVKMKYARCVSGDSLLLGVYSPEMVEEFAKKEVVDSLLKSLEQFVEIKVEETKKGDKVVTAEITVKRPLNEEYKGRMVFR